MTQMMLFDSCPSAATTPAASPVTPAASPVTPAAGPIASPSSAKPATGVSAPKTSAASQVRAETEDGLHRMGDLARLVLLRYQLVAQRRQELASRRGT